MEIETGQRWTFFSLGDGIRLGSLHPYFTYQCEVAAHTIGRGPFSDPFQLKTLETCERCLVHNSDAGELTDTIKIIFISMKYVLT